MQGGVLSKNQQKEAVELNWIHGGAAGVHTKRLLSSDIGSFYSSTLGPGRTSLLAFTLEEQQGSTSRAASSLTLLSEVKGNAELS